ncbi:MAG: hypothetical protein E7609_07970 [Ruminococcaceae bacterium]|nr:hypothetical protein [Oscillospiraceae bacterium]
MQITDIKIRKLFDNDPLRAIVSVTFDDALAVHDIKIIHTSASGRHFVVMPSRKGADGAFHDIVHPINSAFREQLEGAVLEAYHVKLAVEQEVEA